MSTTMDKLRGLVEHLYHATEGTKLEWNLTGDQETVWTSVGTFRVELSNENTDNFERDIRVTVFNQSGDQVDTFSDSYFQGVKPVTVNLNGYYSVMSILLEMAKRQASGADAAIEAILAALGGSAVTDKPVSKGFTDDLDEDVPF